MYAELLRGLGHNANELAKANVGTLKNLLISEVERLELNVDLVVIFDNFNQPLQQALGENFFNFLFALRNARRRLNIVYILVANLSIDLLGFYRLNRLFDKGPDRSVCWMSLLGEEDTAFVIERQLQKVTENLDRLDERDKRRIYELSGGHALLTRHLAHLMLSGKVSVETEPDSVLENRGIRIACEAIWNDLGQNHRNLLIDLAKSAPFVDRNKLQILKNYGVLTDQARFFSPLFESFVKKQETASEVIGVSCDKNKTRIVIQRAGHHQISFALDRLAQRKRRLLCHLVDNLGETRTKDQLKDVGWPSDDEGGVSDQALGRQIDDLRKWLNKQRQLNQYIEVETQWGVGYKLVIKS